ncbi:hypothetical protein C3L33_15256, partial [Rhododendron williamsianum]
MGHSSKKKKKHGGGGRLKGRAPSKDHGSHARDDNEHISEEITALCAIFQDECQVISNSPPLINIKLRPYSKDAGYEDLEVSALLSVRFLPGYPYKCPKLQITLDKGLSKADAENLLSLLHDQQLQVIWACAVKLEMKNKQWQRKDMRGKNSILMVNTRVPYKLDVNPVTEVTHGIELLLNPHEPPSTLDCLS